MAQRFQIVTLRVPYNTPVQGPPSTWAWENLPIHATLIDADPVSDDPEVQPIEKLPEEPLAHLNADDDAPTVDEYDDHLFIDDGTDMSLCAWGKGTPSECGDAADSQNHRNDPGVLTTPLGEILDGASLLVARRADLRLMLDHGIDHYEGIDKDDALRELLDLLDAGEEREPQAGDPCPHPECDLHLLWDPQERMLYCTMDWNHL